MKDNFFRKIVKEQLTKINEIHVYHGTDRQFDTFDLEKIGSGDGRSSGGWGLYFSDNEEVSQRYFLKSGFVKEFEIKNGKYFDLDEQMDEGVAYEIIDELQMDGIEEGQIEEFKSDFIGYIPDVTNKQVYEWLSYVLSSEKNASLFLERLGFKGNKFKDKVIPEATNYVVFNTKYVINYY